MKTADLREKLAANVAEMRSIHDKNESGALDTKERDRFAQLEVECRNLQAAIEHSGYLAEIEKYVEAGGKVHPIETEVRNGRYSVAKAITEQRAGRLTGIEAEAHQELSAGRETRGVMVPTSIFLGGENRALTTAAPVAGPGGNLVATNLAAMTDRRRPALRIEALGATVLPGLTGDLDLPRMQASGAAGWVAEHVAATRTDPQFSKTSMTPRTVTAEYEVSRRMLLQSSTALEPILRADLAFLLAAALDRAAIKGGGTNEPTGIMANSDVTELTAAAFSSALTADLIGALALDDVTGTRAFLTHPAVTNIARKKLDADGHVIPMAELFHGERVETSTQVPYFTGSPAVDPALIYGEWASLYLGYWSGVDLLMNPYHSDVSSKGGALIHAFLDADVVVRHPEGFVWAEVTG